MNKKKSFTLIELLVVIVIIGILAGVIMISTGSSMNKASVAKTKVFSESVKNNLLLNLVNDWDASNYTKSGTTWTLKDSWGSNDGSFRSAPSSSVCSDASGAEACPQLQTDSDIGDVLVFSGADGERINIDANWSANFESVHGPSTLEVWFNQTAERAASYIFSDNCVEWGFYINNNALGASLYGGYSVQNINLNSWYHVVLVHDHSIDDPATATTKETAVKIYVNGEKKVNSVRNITTQNGYTDYPLMIGDDNCTADREFVGKVKQVRIYNMPLAESAIKQNYFSGLKDLLNLGQISEEEYKERINE